LQEKRPTRRYTSKVARLSLVATFIAAILSIISEPAAAAGNQRSEILSTITGKLPAQPDTCTQKSRELRNAGKPATFICTGPPSLEVSQSPAAKAAAAAGPSSRICELIGDDMFGQLKKREECVKTNRRIALYVGGQPVGEYDVHVTL